MIIFWEIIWYHNACQVYLFLEMIISKFARIIYCYFPCLWIAVIFSVFSKSFCILDAYNFNFAQWCSLCTIPESHPGRGLECKRHFLCWYASKKTVNSGLVQIKIIWFRKHPPRRRFQKCSVSWQDADWVEFISHQGNTKVMGMVRYIVRVVVCFSRRS